MENREVVKNDTNDLVTKCFFSLMNCDVKTENIKKYLSNMTSFTDKKAYISYLEGVLKVEGVEEKKINETISNLKREIKTFRWKFEAFQMYNVKLEW